MTLYDFCRQNDFFFSVTSEGAFCTSQPVPGSDRITIGVGVGIGVVLMMVLVVLLFIVVIIRKKKGLLSINTAFVQTTPIVDTKNIHQNISHLICSV